MNKKHHLVFMGIIRLNGLVEIWRCKTCGRIEIRPHRPFDPGLMLACLKIKSQLEKSSATHVDRITKFSERIN